MSTHIEPPTDAQLGYIASLCDDRGVMPPEAVHSKAEASEIIDAIKARSYDPSRYRIPGWPEDAEDIDMRAREASRYGGPDTYEDTPF